MHYILQAVIYSAITKVILDYCTSKKASLGNLLIQITFLNLLRFSSNTTTSTWNEDSSNILASGSDDKSIKIWNFESGSCLLTLNGHRDFVTALHFLGNNKLASGSKDTTIKIWDIESGACLRTLNIANY